MKKIFINICEERVGIKTPLLYQKLYKQLYKLYNITVYSYYIGTQLNNESFSFQESNCCNNEQDLIEKVSLDYSKNEVVYINTAVEGMIELCTRLKNIHGEPVTKNSSAYRDKSQQRDLLAAENQDLAVKYITITHDNIDIDDIESILEYPFIIKPSSGIQSAGVSKISSRDDLKRYLGEYDDFLLKFSSRAFDTNLLKNNSSLVCEEYLDGRMFSIDYFVDKIGNFISTPIVDVKIGKDIGIDDFMNYARSFRESAIKDIDKKSVNTLIQTTIKALGIKNTFIHHEFKLTSSGKLKTIEINGRIGGYRPEMIQEALEFNWLSTVIGETPATKLENNFCSFLVYPEKRGILKGFNQDLFSQIEKLNSIYLVNKIESFIGSEIGLTSQGFTKVAIIKIKNSNTTQFEKDYDFIEKNFKKLLILK